MTSRGTVVPVAHSGGEKILDVALVCISSPAGTVTLSRCFVPFVLLFRSLMLTPNEDNGHNKVEEQNQKLFQQPQMMGKA